MQQTDYKHPNEKRFELRKNINKYNNINIKKCKHTKCSNMPLKSD